MSDKIKPEEFMMFSTQLKQLLESDFPLAEGLDNFAAEIKRPAFRKAVERVADRIGQGFTISEAVEKEPESFSAEYAGLIRAGEESADLAGMLETALEHENFLGRMEGKLRLAVYYPFAVFLFTFIAFGISSGWLYPVLDRYFSYLGKSVPLFFEVVHSLFYGFGGALAIAWLGLAVLLVWWASRRKGLATIGLNIPGLKRLVADVYSARLSRSLGLMLESGVRMDNALAAVAASTGDRGMRVKLIDTARRVGQGARLSSVLVEVGLDGIRFSDLVSIGEEAGSLPKVLVKGADMFKSEAEARLNTAMMVAGSVLILAAGAWVLLILSSLFHAYSLIGWATI